MSRRRNLVAVLAVAATLAGCGADDETETVTQTVDAPGQQDATERTSAEPDRTPPPDSQPAPPERRADTEGSLSQAKAVLRREGYQSIDADAYEPSHTLRVLVGLKEGSATGRAQRAFFFVRGDYIGTDTADDSATIEVIDKEDSLVTLGYQTYLPGEPSCCPTGGQRRVRYGWNGRELTPLDPIPEGRVPR